MTGISALTACAVAWYIPARERVGAGCHGRLLNGYPKRYRGRRKTTRSLSAEAFCSSRTDPSTPP